MLRSLHIKNLAIIDEVQLDFAQGFTVLTGETGAGKSILLDALGLVLGTRADPLLVRQGAEKAEINAAFSVSDAPAARQWLAANELIDEDEPALCLIRRVVYAEGRARAFVNGQAVNAGPLRELGEELVSLYGQNESQTLLRPEVQRGLLDEFGGYPEALSAVAAAHAAHAETEAAIALARANASRDPAATELLRHQVNELLAAKLQAGEAEALEAQHKRLANAGKLMEDGARATELLVGGSGSDGNIDDQLSAARSIAALLAATDPAFAEAELLVAAAQAQVREAASHIQHQLDRLDLDPHTLETLERRLSALHDLARKHRTRLSLLPEHTAGLQAELATLEQAGSTLDELNAERERRLVTYRAAASRLTAARKQAAQKFAALVAGEVRQLGMLNAKFLVSVEDSQTQKVRACGDDDIRFDFSANAGQEPRPLAKVASGGELSRVSLAIQVAMLRQGGESQGAATMIFDEVDAGIGGGVAEIVGQKLKSLGSGRQVFCVTHLPPVAAQGQQHFSIGKTVVKGQTCTHVQLLAQPARIEELARMLGGAELTAATRALASDLLKRAG